MRRLTYEGVSVRQPWNLRALIETGESRKYRQLYFATVIKVANAQKSSLLLDEFRVPTLNVGKVTFSPVDVQFKFRKPGESVYIPLDTEPDFVPDYLPTVVKPDDEKVISLQIQFSFSEPRDRITDTLSDYITQRGLPISLRINGKLRSYTLRIVAHPSEPAQVSLADSEPPGSANS